MSRDNQDENADGADRREGVSPTVGPSRSAARFSEPAGGRERPAQAVDSSRYEGNRRLTWHPHHRPPDEAFHGLLKNTSPEVAAARAGVLDCQRVSDRGRPAPALGQNGAERPAAAAPACARRSWRPRASSGTVDGRRRTRGRRRSLRGCSGRRRSRHGSPAVEVASQRGALAAAIAECDQIARRLDTARTAAGRVGEALRDARARVEAAKAAALPTRPTRTPRRCWVARSRLPTGRCAGSARASGMLRPISRRRAARRRKSKPRSANMKRSSVVRRGVSRMQSPRSWRARSTASSRRPRRCGGSSTTSMLFGRFWRTRRRRGMKRLTGLALRCRRRRRARLGPIISGAPRWRRGGRRVRRCCAMSTLRCHADSRGGITALGRNGKNGEGFRAPALFEGWACAGAGVRKPPKEETAGRQGDRSASAPMGI